MYIRDGKTQVVLTMVLDVLRAVAKTSFCGEDSCW